MDISKDIKQLRVRNCEMFLWFSFTWQCCVLRRKPHAYLLKACWIILLFLWLVAAENKSTNFVITVTLFFELFIVVDHCLLFTYLPDIIAIVVITCSVKMIFQTKSHTILGMVMTIKIKAVFKSDSYALLEMFKMQGARQCLRPDWKVCWLHIEVSLRKQFVFNSVKHVVNRHYVMRAGWSNH